MPEEIPEKYTVDKNGIKRRARRSYTDEFKQQIVDLYKTGGHTHDQLRREYELTPSTLTRWLRQSRNSGSFREKDNRTSEENELIQLRKQNKQLLVPSSKCWKFLEAPFIIKTKKNYQTSDWNLKY